MTGSIRLLIYGDVHCAHDAIRYTCVCEQGRAADFRREELMRLRPDMLEEVFTQNKILPFLAAMCQQATDFLIGNSEGKITVT